MRWKTVRRAFWNMVSVMVMPLRWGWPVVPAICRRWAIGSCGVDILPQARIGGGCYIAHGLGLVVGGTTVIGEDCTLLQGVTLGEARFTEDACPRIGDRVTIGIDDIGVISGGPNAMDAPLSYMSPMITEELIVDRGIASVSRAPESIGGYMNTRLARGDFEYGAEDIGRARVIPFSARFEAQWQRGKILCELQCGDIGAQ